MVPSWTGCRDGRQSDGFVGIPKGAVEKKGEVEVGASIATRWVFACDAAITERCRSSGDAWTGEPRYPFDQFFVPVDDILPGWLTFVDIVRFERLRKSENLTGRSDDHGMTSWANRGESSSIWRSLAEILGCRRGLFFLCKKLRRLGAFRGAGMQARLVPGLSAPPIPRRTPPPRPPTPGWCGSC